MAFSTIHTLEGRGNILLEVVKSRFNVADSAMRRLIWQSADRLSSMLRAKGVRYSELKGALVPRKDKGEVALLFDRASIESAWYGWQVHAQILRLLKPNSSHSVLHGDLSDEAARQDWIKAALEIHLQASGSQFSIGSSNQVYCVYLNNVSPHLRRTLHDTLKKYRPYIGYADTTYTSQFKAYLSQTLVPAYLKHKRIVLQSHPDDDPPTLNENMLGYPFEDAGLRCRSIPDSYYGVFLSYKIERPVLSDEEADSRLSANVISDTPEDLSSYTVEIERTKFDDYLKKKKTGVLRRLGVLGAPKATLEQLVQAKLMSNYIYSMSYSHSLEVGKFNILLELAPLDGGHPVRTLAAFEHLAKERQVRLLTLF